MKWTQVVAILPALVLISSAVPAQQPVQSEREAMYYRYLEFPSYVRGGSIEPHWMADGSSFWYAEGEPANTVIWKVDPKANSKTPLFDTARLRQALTPLLGHEPPYQGLPFQEFSFVDEGEKAVKFMAEDKDFILRLETYTISPAAEPSKEEKSRLVPQITRGGLHERPALKEVLSPDRQWLAGVRDFNIWRRSTSDGVNVQLTTDGIEDHEWGDVEFRWANWADWAPNTSKLAVIKVDGRKVPKIPIVHWLKPRPEVEWVRRVRAGDPIPETELFVIDILTERQVRVDAGDGSDHHIVIVGWWPDGSELLFLRTDREAKKLDLMAANPTNGATRVILSENQETFVIGLGWRGPSSRPFHFYMLENDEGFIWASERSGWNHLIPI